ncbi:hypothetical protein BHM03_00007485 [Ensete ventricosum]|nr:hypothetical protein BHM03_00007485 [Ensete ventricosum]
MGYYNWSARGWKVGLGTAPVIVVNGVWKFFGEILRIVLIRNNNNSSKRIIARENKSPNLDALTETEDIGVGDVALLEEAVADRAVDLLLIDIFHGHLPPDLPLRARHTIAEDLDPILGPRMWSPTIRSHPTLGPRDRPQFSFRPLVSPRGEEEAREKKERLLGFKRAGEAVKGKPVLETEKDALLKALSS